MTVIFQAFRHLYVLATEARWIQTVDVDTGLPVYAPFEVTVRETEHYSETSYCEVTPCILPERAIVSYADFGINYLDSFTTTFCFHHCNVKMGSSLGIVRI